jgi:enoyl-[acyl-carrier-protein] reductase (NADH)
MTVRYQEPKPEPKHPRDYYGWMALAQKAVEAADRLKDRRASGLRAAILSGMPEKTLRMLGIICEADISREFSKKNP